MEYHILNGDALKAQFPNEKIAGKLLVCRECFVEGNVTGKTLNEFWKNRAQFISENYNYTTEEYYQKTSPEFEQIAKIPPHSTINLWFEDDLFCQVNLWFIVWYLNQNGISQNIFLIKPDSENWTGFGRMSEPKLMKAYWNRKSLSSFEITILENTWLAFQRNDFEALEELKGFKSSNFPFWEEVLQAHLDRFSNNGNLGRPEQILLKIVEEKQTKDFGIVFQEFNSREGIYGFGDLQVKNLFQKIINKNQSPV